jgi:SAM-dependent methyltransferase
MDSSGEGPDVWKRIARNWQHVGSPQRPTDEDGRLMLALAGPALAAHRAPGVVVMGVTPEIVRLPWPAGTRILALDRSAEMIASVWQPHPRLYSQVARARWQSMPIKDRSIALAVGDGSLNALPRMADYPVVLGEVARILKPGGSMVLRCFVRPERPERMDEIAAAARGGGIGSFSALKWRIAMALDGGGSCSVAVAGIRAAFDRLFPDRDRLSRATGWARQTVDTIDSFKDVATRYSFPTLQAIGAVAAPVFDLTGVRRGHYEMADQCPTLSFSRAV